MKKILIVLLIGLCCTPMVFGTIVTNTNQSVVYLRFPARNASTDIDAVYFNPAGVTHLSKGWHFSLNNQTFFQKKTITNTFPLLNNDTYISDVGIPVFPSVFVAYKMNKLAFSFGFGPNAGGGTADFTNGLPTFETGISMLPVALTLLGIPTTQYSADIQFKGSSIYLGFQLNASYEIHEMISVAAGLRYIYAVNTYEGAIENIMINPGGGPMMSASQFFNMMGMPAYAALFSDMSVDAKQVATGLTPIFSANFSPLENLNIGARYELNTKLEFEYQTTTDDTGLFPDGEIQRYDTPAILAIGADYDIMPKLKAAVSFNMYFDKNADWEGREDLVDSNSYDLGFALEYDLTKKIALSAGYLWTQIDVSDDYQSDMSYELSSSGYFFGGRYSFNDKLSFDIGTIIVDYADSDVTIPYAGFGQFKESYEQTTWGFGVALNYHM